MSINIGFIPCAGKGTRMGPLGKKLAKPLWHIFDKTMLEVQCDYLKYFLGVKDLFINTNHNHKQFDRVEGVESFHEEKLLGSGGNVHNVKRELQNAGKMVILNPDVNIFLSENDLDLLKSCFRKYDFVMVCLPVKLASEYNEVNVSEEGFFVNVSCPNLERDYVTYSGFGMVNLSKIKMVEGESSFFDSVITEKSNCFIFTPSDPYEYWDWGSDKQYKENIQKLSNPANNSELKKFLIESDAIDLSEITEKGYRTNHDNCYNFSLDIKMGKSNSIVISKQNDGVLLVDL